MSYKYILELSDRFYKLAQMNSAPNVEIQASDYDDLVFYNGKENTKQTQASTYPALWNDQITKLSAKYTNAVQKYDDDNGKALDPIPFNIGVELIANFNGNTSNVTFKLNLDPPNLSSDIVFKTIYEPFKLTVAAEANKMTHQLLNNIKADPKFAKVKGVKTFHITDAGTK